MTVERFLSDGQPQDFIIVLRHDVDRSLQSAIRMAELEATHGLQATYYLRAVPRVFRPKRVAYLNRLGHEVGYHYEVLAKARGDIQRARALFGEELEKFRGIVHVNTASMHGSPLSPWNNLDLWRACRFQDFGLNGEVSLSIRYENVVYLTDTGRSWDDTRYNLRDRVASRSPSRRLHSTDDLIGFLSEGPDGPVLLNAHPNRWASNWLGWGASYLSDWTINRVKRLVQVVRGPNHKS